MSFDASSTEHTTGGLTPSVSTEPIFNQTAVNVTGFEPRYGWWHIYLTGIILGCIILCTIIGNVFVVAAIILEKNLQSVSNYLILSLAVADLMVATLVMPISALNAVSSKWWLGMELCDIWICFDVLCCTASILHLVAIAIDRYWAVTNVDYIRRRTARRIITMILIVWVISIIISIPARFYPGRSEIEWDKVLVKGECGIYQGYAFTIFSVLGAFYLPMGFMIGIYARIYQTAKKRIRRKAFNKHKKAKSSRPFLQQQGDAEVNSKSKSARLHAGNGCEVSLGTPDPPDSNRSVDVELRDTAATMVSDHNLTQSAPSSTELRNQHYSHRGGPPPDLVIAPRPTVSITAADGNTLHLSTTDAEDETSSPTSGSLPLPSDDIEENHHSRLLATTAFTRSADGTLDSSKPPANHASHDVEKNASGGVGSRSTGFGKGFHFKSPPSPFRKRRVMLTERDQMADDNSLDGDENSQGGRPRGVRSIEAMKERLEHKRERKAARTLAIITGCFLLCWIPFFINALCMPFNNEPILPGIWEPFALWLGYFNSLLNPVIYTIFSPDFRAAFRKILFGRYHRQKVRR